MTGFLQLLSNFFNGIFAVLNVHLFDIGGVNVTLSEILLGFLALSLCISVFWKGARG